MDGISYPLVVLTALLTLLCCLYVLFRVEDDRRGRLLIALLLAVEVGIAGVFLSLDLVLFFIFFEVVLLPMYAIIAGWGGENRRHAAVKFVLYTLLGSVLLLVGVVLVVVKAGHRATWSCCHPVAGAALSSGTQLAAFVLLALAFAVKSPLWPLHTWLPDAHTEAPTVGSVILAGVLLKMGTYGLLRVAVGVLPDAARRVAPVLGVLAVAAIIVGCLVCLAQSELKRLIAYSSVGHMGFVLLGHRHHDGDRVHRRADRQHRPRHHHRRCCSSWPARSSTGPIPAGWPIWAACGSASPVLAGLLAFAAIASLGLPGLAGFWGEAFAVVASLGRNQPLWTVLGVLAAVGGVLTAAYFLRMLRQVTHGPAAPVSGWDQPSVSPRRTGRLGAAGGAGAAWSA